MNYLNGLSTLNDLSLVSDQSIVLPDLLPVNGDMRISGFIDVTAADGSIDIIADRLLFRSGSAATLNTVVNQLDVTTQGELIIDNASGLELIDLDCDLMAAQNQSSSGDLTVNTNTSLTVSDDVIAGPLTTTDSRGRITLVSEKILLNDVVAAKTGEITVTADAEVHFSSSGILTTVAGNIDLVAETIQMDDGSKIVAGRDDTVAFNPANPLVELAVHSGGGTVSMMSGSTIELASIQTNNATADAVNIVSRSGVVVDGGDSDLEIIAEQPNSVVNIETTFGMGAGNPLDTSIAQLTAISRSTGDIEISELNAIRLLDLDTVNGLISVTATGNIEAIDVHTREADAVEDNRDSVVLNSIAGSIFTDQLVTADEVELTAAGSISDLPGGMLIAAGGGSFNAAARIDFANDAGRQISIAEHTIFDATSIRIGQDDRPAGDAAALNVDFGTVSICADDAVIIEDDATTFAASTEVTDRLSIASAGSINNLADTTLIVEQGHAQFNTPQIVDLGNQLDDVFRIASVGVVSTDASLELDQGLTIAGNSPNLSPSSFGTAASFGTRVDQTLFVTSTGQIVQTDGDLHARFLGLQALGHVELASVSDFNQTLAVTANGASILSTPQLTAQLQSLAGVENSEVDASRAHSIAFLHQGRANIGTVGSPIGSAMAVGLQSNDSSIFVSSIAGIEVHDDILAQSNSNDPQITLYVANATAADPQIEFFATAARTQGPQNSGIVNAPHTTATFFDSEGFVFRGTTEILVLNPDGSASQDVVLLYGHPGETGYRVGVVWDVDNQPANPVEVLNTYVANLSDPTEAFDDQIYRDNPTRLLLIGGNEGVRGKRSAKLKAIPKTPSSHTRMSRKFFRR